MRVLQAIPGIAARYGGPSQAVLQMSRALGRRGVESLIVTTDADGPGRLPVDLGSPIDYQGVPTIFFSRQLSEGFKYSNSLARWIQGEVKRFDLVHIHAIFSHSSLAAARACRQQNVPYVIRPLGSLAPWGLSRKRLRKRLLWHLGARQMLCGAAEIHYTTAGERRLADGMLGLGRGIVIPLGIDSEILNAPMVQQYFRRRYPALGEHPYVLILSRLHPIKGLELFLDSFLELARREEFRHWRLVVAGDGEPDYVEQLRRRVDDHGGDRSVLFTGWIDGDLKLAALKEAALFALPSQYESFSLSVVEAMACGVPSLISANVNLAEEIGAAGAGWITPLNPLSLLSTLADALRDTAGRTARGAAGRDLVLSRFTWQVVAAELLRMYESIRR